MLFWILMTILALFLVQFVYIVTQMIVGQMVGATVMALSIGVGPTIFKTKFMGIDFTVSPLPINAYTKFHGNEEDPEIESEESETPPTKFGELSIVGRILIMLSGPVSTCLLAITCLVAATFGTGKVFVDRGNGPDVLAVTGVPGLAISDGPSDIAAQLRLFRDTIIPFFERLLFIKPADGWGGVVAWIVTCGNAGTHSVAAWCSCFGAVCLAIGIFNLFPVPVLNGGYIMFVLYEGLLGPAHERTQLILIYLGLLFLLCLLLRFAVIDLNWLLG